MCGDIYIRYSYNYYYSNHYGTLNIVTYFTDITKDFVIDEKLKSTSIYVLLGKDKYLIVDVWSATYPSF